MDKHFTTATDIAEQPDSYIECDVPHWKTFEYNSPPEQTPSTNQAPSDTILAVLANQRATETFS